MRFQTLDELREEAQISQRLWVKVLGMLEQNWCVIEDCPGGAVELVFFDDHGHSIDDPYEILRDLGAEMLGESLQAGQDPDALVIAEGGAAATAYSRLQFEDLQDAQRSQIKQALLQYCELDTLAMVMVVQGWQQEIRQ